MTFNENSRVKIPALIHLERLGYKYLSLRSSNWDRDTNIFTEILDQSLSRLNPEATSEELEIFKKKSLASLDNDDLGKVFYSNLIAQSGLKLIDFDNFKNNIFNCVSTEALGTAKEWWPSAKPGPLTPTTSCQWLSVTFNHEEEMPSL